VVRSPLAIINGVLPAPSLVNLLLLPDRQLFPEGKRMKPPNNPFWYPSGGLLHQDPRDGRMPIGVKKKIWRHPAWLRRW